MMDDVARNAVDVGLFVGSKSVFPCLDEHQGSQTCTLRKETSTYLFITDRPSRFRRIIAVRVVVS